MTGERKYEYLAGKTNRDSNGKVLNLPIQEDCWLTFFSFFKKNKNISFFSLLKR